MVQTFHKLFHSTVCLFIDQSCVVFHFQKQMFLQKKAKEVACDALS